MNIARILIVGALGCFFPMLVHSQLSCYYCSTSECYTLDQAGYCSCMADGSTCTLNGRCPSCPPGPSDIVTGHPWVQSPDLVENLSVTDPTVGVVIQSLQRYSLAKHRNCAGPLLTATKTDFGIARGNFSVEGEVLTLLEPTAMGPIYVVLRLSSDGAWNITYPDMDNRSIKGTFKTKDTSASQ
jgi:hypothetical protein